MEGSTGDIQQVAAGGGENTAGVTTFTKNLEGKKVSWGKLLHTDSLQLEAGRLTLSTFHNSKTDWRTTLLLAFQSIGVIYGDIGTSPLYVFSGTFPDKIHDMDDILGVLSLIIYTIILIPLIKYVIIVLQANDNGDGGTFALYSLICRYAKVSLIPNHEAEDRELSNYRLELDIPSTQLKRAQKIKDKLENSYTSKIVLLLVTILGTSMVIGDGILTPCITVLSAVGGIPSLSEDATVWFSIAILVVLFCSQWLGTDKVGYSFAPILCLWFLVISGIGLYNLFKYGIGVLCAFNPLYIIYYFKRNGKQAWVSLGGVVLCITGTEAMFADLGHFNMRAVQVSFSGIVLPALLTAYSGQAAYLRKFPDNVADAFYKSIPGPIYWPTFVLAVAAAVIASQALISGAFAIISQSLSLGCFPRVKVVRTSAKHEGQVYIPEINYLLMIACVAVTYGFRTTEKIGNAYGIAVVAVMVITTCMVTLIMLMIWKMSIWWITLFFVVFMSVEGLYLSSVLYKFTQGGYLPLAFALVLMIIMGVWHYVTKERYLFELNNKVSTSYIKDLATNPHITRMPGIGLLYSELVQGIPPIFPHVIANVPSIHSVLVFVSIKNIPISKVVPEERFLFRQVEPKEYRIYRCVVRYGYKDEIEEPKVFERQLVENLKGFINTESYVLEGGAGSSDQHVEAAAQAQSRPINISNPLVDEGRSRRFSPSTVCVEEEVLVQQKNPSRASSSSIQSFHEANSSSRIISGLILGAMEEMQFVEKALDHGVVYLLGEADVMAKQTSSILKKIVINYAYSFLRKNSRQGDKVLAIPKTRLLRVGMTYEI